MLIIQGIGEVGDLLAVELGKIRVQPRHGRGCCFKPGQEFHSLGLQGRHLVLDGAARDARLYGFDQPADLTLDLLEVTRGAIAASVLFGSLSVNFSAELVDEGGDQFWLDELVLKPIQDRRFELVGKLVGYQAKLREIIEGKLERLP